MSAEAMLQCYNRTCGQTFNSEDNKEDSCVHHPGLPVFHDAYKKWSCCDKRTTDFTEFLNIKGCTRSYHSNVKPLEPEKSAPSDGKEEVHNIRPPLEQTVIFERPDVNEPMTKLHMSVSASLKTVLEKLAQENKSTTDTVNDAIIQPNTPCQNKGCRQVYEGEQTNEQSCFYHSGVPIFHEGMKYWSCCVKRTTDFDSFLDQVGCAVGKHKWIKDKSSDTCAKCRYDWHQTGNFVIISIYAKCPLPDFSLVEANGVKLCIRISFGKERQIFEETFVLYGVIDIKGSSATYLGTKVEIKLKKAQPVSWKELTSREENLNIDAMRIKDS